MTIEMIRRNVEYRRRRQLQRLGGLELEARQLEHVKLCSSIEQVQSWRAEVATDADAQPCGFRHLADQRRHCALAVAASDADHRRLRRTREQFDVADQLDAGSMQLLHETLFERHTGRQHGETIL